MHNKIIVISGPSGSGKGTIASFIIKRLAPNLVWAKTATTRPPRRDDSGLSRRVFLSEAEFEQAIENGDVIESIQYNGHRYGTLKSELDKVLADSNALLEIDIEGALKIKKIFGNQAQLIFIKVPVEQLRHRLIERGMPAADISTRLKIAQTELSKIDACDLVVDNGDNRLDDAVDQVIRFIRDL
jgi:guanylate kinase